MDPARDGPSQGAVAEEPSACAVLAPSKALGDNYGTRLQLRVPTPQGWSSESAASELFAKVKPAPAWVAAWTSELFLEFIIVWGERQPQRQKLKDQLPSFLPLDKAGVKQVFTAAGVSSWRFDAVAALRRMQQKQPSRLSCAGLLTQELLGKVAVELKGLQSWSDKDKDLAKKAEELMKRHVYGNEDLDTRVLADSFFQADLLKRKGPVNFVADMKERVRQAGLEGQTLASLCTTAGAGAAPFQFAGDLNGSGWQLEIMSALAKPVHQIRGVLVLGPPRCGKSHVGHQLYAALPRGAVVKVQEADQADIYTFGTCYRSMNTKLALPSRR